MPNLHTVINVTTLNDASGDVCVCVTLALSQPVNPEANQREGKCLTDFYLYKGHSSLPQLTPFAVTLLSSYKNTEITIIKYRESSKCDSLKM